MTIGEMISLLQKIIWVFQAVIDLALNPELTLERLKPQRKLQLPALEVDKYAGI